MHLSTPTSREHNRAFNQQAVLSAIHRHGQISRVDLAAALKLSSAALSDITGTLIARGLIYEARPGTSGTVGRKPILLEIDYTHAYVLGVKVSSAAVTTALTNLRAEVVGWRSDVPAQLTPDAVTTLIDQAAADLCHTARLRRDQLVGVGVGLPGIIDTASGVCRDSYMLGWRDVPLTALLEARLGLPTLIDNDVGALAAAETWFGSRHKHSSFLVVTLGRGVGLGIVLNGAVYRGPHGGAGHFGHTTVDPAGPRCSCGKRGCLEAYLADHALLESARLRLGDFPDEGTTNDLMTRAAGGCAAAEAVYADAGRLLGRALSDLVNLFAPSLVILSGEGMQAAPFLLPATREALAEHSFGDLATRVELAVTTWGDDAWARGAAGLAASRYLLEAAATVGG